MILTELSPLMPERASITLSRMFCEKFQVMPGQLGLQLRTHRIDDFLLRAGSHGAERSSVTRTAVSLTPWPILFRTQRDEVFAVVVTVSIRGVVGPAELVDDRLNLGIGRHDGPCFRESSVCRSREMFNGAVPRIQRFPSSKAGMNSRPSSGSIIAVPIDRAAMMPTVT